MFIQIWNETARSQLCFNKRGPYSQEEQTFIFNKAASEAIRFLSLSI